MPPAERIALLAEATDEELAELEALVAAELAATSRWQVEARPEQLSPAGAWFVWLILAGRGWGKTRTGAEWVAEQARQFPGCRVALVAATFADGRDTMVEGESGLLSVLDPSELRGGDVDKAWNRSLGELFWANGSRAKIYSSEKPRQLRGPQHHFAWADEIAQWEDARLGCAQDTTWSNLAIGVRLPARPDWPAGFSARVVATTTPKPVALLRVADRLAGENPALAGLLQRDTTVTTRGRTQDNLANLSTTYRQTVVDPLAGTRLGRQELDGLLLEDVEGALWTLTQIEADRVLVGALPRFVQVVTAVDPATTSTAGADHTGIVTAARGVDNHGYVLGDATLRDTPIGWGVAAWRAALQHGSEAIVVEDNQGGEMVETVLATAWQQVAADYQRAGRMPPPIRRVHAVSNKRTRAVPIATMYEQHLWHHVAGAPGDSLISSNPLVLLEDQMTTWDGSGDSPDRVDALVHAGRFLFLGQAGPGRSTVVPQGRWGGLRR